MIPDQRIAEANRAPVRPDRDFVLYWMVAARRSTASFALDRAIQHARELQRPLLVLEALRSDHPWASERFHDFVLAGMADNAAAFARSPVTYHPYVETRPGAGKGLLEALGRRACIVVTDDFPCFFVPRMVAAAAARLDVRVEQVDGNGLLPMRAADKAFARAVDLRRFLQRVLPDHLGHAPKADPLARLELPKLGPLPAAVTRRWPACVPTAVRADLTRLPIDHEVAPVAELAGGTAAAKKALARFLDHRLARYDEDRNHPDRDGASGLSPYLHFGHLSVHEVLARLASREQWTIDSLGDRVDGKRTGFWGMSAPAESFLDELVTWRELGLNMCSHREDYHRYESLPDWARTTLAEHEPDQRPWLYGPDELSTAATHDPIWNAAQNQLMREGRIHNYLRMLWGKKILEWTPSPRDALAVMIELNNRFALDGRDPNSYSGIFWVLGRYDRPWGPERPVFGKIRCMTSDSARRKLDLDDYVARYASAGEPANG